MQLHTLAMLCATLRIPHSVLTFSVPLNMNLRNPQFCFNLPNTASTSTGLLDHYLRPFSDSNLSLAAWRYCSSIDDHFQQHLWIIGAGSSSFVLCLQNLRSNLFIISFWVRHKCPSGISSSRLGGSSILWDC